MSTRLVVISGRAVTRVQPPAVVTIGRDPASTVWLNDDRVSRHHARVSFDGRAWVYEDLGATNGSFVGGVSRGRFEIGPGIRVHLANPADGPLLDFRTGGSQRTAGRAVAVSLIVLGTGAVGLGLMQGRLAPPHPIPSPSAVATARILTSQEIAAAGTAAVVLISVSDGHGSGVYVGADRVLTANHVVSSGGSIRVTFGISASLAGRVIARDIANDLALLVVPGLEATRVKAVAFGSSAALVPGDRIIVVGYPATAGLTITQGIVSGHGYRGTSSEVIQTDAAINPGNSGGPLLNDRGELVGIADFSLRGTTGLNFAVASDAARRFVDSH